MTPAELEAFAERKLGSMCSVVKPQLRSLADRLRPGEQLETLAIGWRGLLIGGGCLVAVTDQHLLLLWSLSNCEELKYADIISVTDDTSLGEISLVTPHTVHTLRVLPEARAAEIVAAVATRIGEDRVHPPAGADEARRITGRFIGAVVSACIFVAVYAMGSFISGVVERRSAHDRAHAPLSKGSCVDVQALTVDCGSNRAVFVVLGDRDMRRCPSSSPVIVDSLADTTAARHRLSAWCIGPNVPARAR